MDKNKMYTGLKVILKSIGTFGRIFEPYFGALSAAAELMDLKNLPESKNNQLKEVMEITAMQTATQLGLSDNKINVIRDIGLRLENIIESGKVTKLNDNALECSFLSFSDFNTELTPKDLREIITIYRVNFYKNISKNQEICNFLDLQSNDYIIELLKQNQTDNIYIKELLEKISNYHNSSKLASSGLEVITNTRPYFVTKDFILHVDVVNTLISNINSLNSNVLVLCGMGGIGKTEICRYLFHNWVTYGLQSIIGWLHFDENILKTFYKHFDKVLPYSASDKNDYFNSVRKYIEEQEQEVLLFIDNVNILNDSDINELCLLPCKVIITSRNSELSERFLTMKMPLISEANCTILYQMISGVTESDQDAIRQIVLLSMCHTLTIILLAKTQKKRKLTTQQMLELLRIEGFSLESINESIQWNYSENDDNSKNIFGNQLLKVFRLSDLNMEQRRILSLFAFFEPSLLIKVSEAVDWFSTENLDDFNDIVSLGWLQDEVDGYSMHPIISTVLLKSNAPSFHEFIIILRKLVSFFTEIQDEARLELHYLSFSNQLINHHMILANNDEGLYQLVNFYFKNGLFNEKMGKTINALESFFKALECKYSVSNDIDEMIDNIFSHIGDGYIDLGNYNEALFWLEKSLDYRIQAYGKESFETAKALSCISKLYIECAKYDIALNLSETALNIAINNNIPPNADISNMYINIAKCHSKKGDYYKALCFYDKELTNCKQICASSNSIDISKSYNNIASILTHLKRYDDAIELYKNSLSITKQLLGDAHPFTATLYNNLGGAYLRLNNYSRSTENFNMARKIRENTLGLTHTSTATTYLNIVLLYRAMNKYEDAIQLCKKAVNILENNLGHSHPNVANAYFNMAQVYADIEDFEMALKCCENVIGTYANKLGVNHLNTEMAFSFIQDIYNKINPKPFETFHNWLDKALKASAKAIQDEKEF